MSEYRGQPNYIRAGFWNDLFEEWRGTLTDDEWGEWVGSLMDAIGRAVSVGQEDRALVLIDWVRDELQAVWEQQDEYWLEEMNTQILNARESFNRATAYWRKRAIEFKGEAALEEEIARVPNWMRPMSDETKKAMQRDELQRRLREAEKTVAGIQQELERLDS